MPQRPERGIPLPGVPTPMRYVAIIAPAWLAFDVLFLAALSAVRRHCRRAYARRAAIRLGLRST